MLNPRPTPAQIARVLNGAANLIENTGWTRNAKARDARYRPISPFDSRACRFCIHGAIEHTAGYVNLDEELIALDFILPELVDWNDQLPPHSDAKVIERLRQLAVDPRVTGEP